MPEKPQDQRKTEAGDHESTWGATEVAKSNWDNKHGAAARKAAAAKNEQADAA